MYWYKLILSYDGTDYFGWQEQCEGPTVAGIFKKTFLHIFKQEQVYFVGASRTDAGVHAKGQVVRLGTALPLEPEKLRSIMNNALPLTIAIEKIFSIDRSFHPQHNVAYKVYTYRIFTKRPCPQMQRYGYFYWHPIDKNKLYEVLQVFVGTHDFKAFSKKNGDLDTVRTVLSIEMVENSENNELIIKITGISFLQYMIRRIIGASLAIASDLKRSKQEIEAILKYEYLSKNLPKAPAKGLCLEKIVYKND